LVDYDEVDFRREIVFERRTQIMRLLAAKSFYRLTELAGLLNTSLSSVRREIDALQQEGVVQRTHGGVIFLGATDSLPLFRERKDHMAKEKQLIGKRAADLVEDGDTVIIDGGTTPYQVAMHLKTKDIQVVTNSLPVANLFADSRRVQLLSTGGTLYPGTGVFLGPYAAAMLKNVRAQKAFIGVAGITEEGLHNSNELVVETERHILDSAKKVYVVADHTKFERNAVAFLCDFSKIAGIVTDRPSEETKRVMQTLKHPTIEWIFASAKP
jgi:DeoR/GlpR family transcriptional regulator of sugar metabolism